jgi:HEAT repeat protein
MGDVEDKRGIQILQGFLNDPDEDIKQAAQDTIEQLQDVPEPSSQPTQSQITGHVSQ